MKIRKIKFSTKLSDLYGRDGYQSHIEQDREYWRYFFGENKISELYGADWYKIKITYVRSKCFFYVFSDYPEIEEDFCSVNSFLGATLVFADIDPIKDIGKDMLGDLETAKIKYCFNDERTIVKNWPNEKEIELDEEEIIKKFKDYPAEYLLIKMLELKNETN